ncbi:MAG: site-specific integrase [Clostridiales bacterium]|nr:site-specific integrase [Clostridiales bacterium]
MAYTRPIELKDGSLCYEIIVSRGRSQKPVSVRWHPEPEWSQRYTERQLTAFAADLEKRVKAGEVVSKKERKAQREAQEREKAQAFTVFSFSELWLKQIELERKPGTVAAYRNCLEKRILPALGDEKLVDVTVPQLASFLLDIQKDYSNSSTSITCAVLSLMFDYAEQLGAVPVNPMLTVRRPRKKLEAKPTAPETLTAEQIQLIRARLEDEPIWTRAFVSFLIDSGARKGEAAALRWSDIDFSTGAVIIERSMGPSGDVTDTKTHKARTVYIGSDTLSTLKQLRKEQAALCLTSWVFSRPGKSQPTSPNSAGNTVRAFGRKIRIPLHCHLFRHSFASNALAAGASPVDIAAQLGHSSTKMTLDTYSHSTTKGQQRAAETFREAIGENK